MLKEELRHTHFPYCLMRNSDGSYVMLNRNYKPVGFMTGEYVKYEEFPISFHAKGLTKKMAAALSARGDEDLERIYLYHDGCIPTADKKSMDAYLARIGKLLKLKLKD